MWISSQVIWARCRELWDQLSKSYREFVVLSASIFDMAGMALNRA